MATGSLFKIDSYVLVQSPLPGVESKITDVRTLETVLPDEDAKSLCRSSEKMRRWKAPPRQER